MDMNEYEDFAHDTIPVVAKAIFSGIVPQEQYLVVQKDQAAKFNLGRMAKGLPANLVSRDGAPDQLPIRDYGIYQAADTPSGSDQISLGFVNLLLGEEVAVAKYGFELTVEDIWAAATVYVLARMEELPALPDKAPDAVPDL